MSTLRATLLAAIALLLATPAGALALSERTLYEDGHGDRLLLDGDWLLRMDREDQGLAQRFQDQVSTAGWATVQVPHAHNAGDDSPESQRGTIAWYRKDFRLPREAGGSHRFRFEAVNYRATVFLNGREIGRHEGGYVPFEVPGERLSRRGVNRLVIRVDNRRTDGDLPPLRDSEVTGLPGGGWWNYGGLLREVYLRGYEDVDIEELLVRPELPCRTCDATVLLRARLRNDAGARRRVRLAATIGGRRVQSRPITIASGRTREVSERVRIENPRLWELGKPRLYAVRARVVSGRRTLSSYDTHVGIRSLAVDDSGRMLLNGRRVVLRGASIHEDDPRLGAALTPQIRERMFGYLKKLRGNITRAHYPLHPHFLEMADREGVLVWSQIPFYRIRESLITSSVRRKGLDYLEEMVRRDWNHPSVLAWSIANELSRNVDANQSRFIGDALKRLERLDPTRLTAIDIAGYPSVRLVPIYRRFDAIGVNSYFGWYPGPIGSVLNREVLGPYLDQLHEYYRRQALFATEFGAEANRHGPAEEKGTFAFQEQFMKDHLDTYDARPFVNGAIAWLLQDFKVRPGWDGYNRKPSPPYNKKGLVDENGNRKPAFAVTARSFSAAIRRGPRRSRRSTVRAPLFEDPLATTAQTAFQPDRVRLLAIFRTLELGERALLSGQFRHLDDPEAKTEPYPDRAVTLEEAPHPHDVWTPVETKTTDQEGYFFFQREPALNTRYRVRAVDPPVVSPEPLIRVRIAADLDLDRGRVREGGRVIFSGTATPAHDGLPVLIQKKSEETGRYATFSTARLRASGDGRSSTFSKRLRLRRGGEFRVRVPGDADHLPGMSGTEKIVVVPKKKRERERD